MGSSHLYVGAFIELHWRLSGADGDHAYVGAISSRQTFLTSAFQFCFDKFPPLAVQLARQFGVGHFRENIAQLASISSLDSIPARLSIYRSLAQTPMSRKGVIRPTAPFHCAAAFDQCRAELQLDIGILSRARRDNS